MFRERNNIYAAFMYCFQTTMLVLLVITIALFLKENIGRINDLLFPLSQQSDSTFYDLFVKVWPMSCSGNQFWELFLFSHKLHVGLITILFIKIQDTNPIFK